MLEGSLTYDFETRSGLKKSEPPGLEGVGRYFNVAAPLVGGIKREGELVMAVRRLSLMALVCALILLSASPAAADHPGWLSDSKRKEVTESEGSVTLTWTAPSTQSRGDLGYQWRTEPLSAVADGDFVPAQGASLSRLGLVTIGLVDDSVGEQKEEFGVLLWKDGATNWDPGQLQGSPPTSRANCEADEYCDYAVVVITDDDPEQSAGPGKGGASNPSKSAAGSQGAGSTSSDQPGSSETKVGRHDAADDVRELLPGPGFELIGSELASGPTADPRVSGDKGDIATTVALVLLAAVPVLGGGAWIWRRRTIW